MENTYLVHHGILGQKWGARRFQNPDGSLTSAGQKRYLKNYKKKKHISSAKAKVSKNNTIRFVNAHNAAVDKLNNGLIDKYQFWIW